MRKPCCKRCRKIKENENMHKYINPARHFEYICEDCYNELKTSLDRNNIINIGSVGEDRSKDDKYQFMIKVGNVLSLEDILFLFNIVYQYTANNGYAISPWNKSFNGVANKYNTLFDRNGKKGFEVIINIINEDIITNYALLKENENQLLKNTKCYLSSSELSKRITYHDSNQFAYEVRTLKVIPEKLKIWFLDKEKNELNIKKTNKKIIETIEGIERQNR